MMKIVPEQTENVVDLDRYREARVRDGTWPPSDFDTHEYWRSRRRDLLKDIRK